MFDNLFDKNVYEVMLHTISENVYCPNGKIANYGKHNYRVMKILVKPTMSSGYVQEIITGIKIPVVKQYYVATINLKLDVQHGYIWKHHNKASTFIPIYVADEVEKWVVDAGKIEEYIDKNPYDEQVSRLNEVFKRGQNNYLEAINRTAEMIETEAKDTKKTKTLLKELKKRYNK